MRKKIPKFKSEKEEALFWSKNSPLDYPDEFTDIKEPINFAVSLAEKVMRERKERKSSVTFRMEPSQLFLLKIIAKISDNNYQTMMRNWIRERIRKELKNHPNVEKEVKKQHTSFYK